MANEFEWEEETEVEESAYVDAAWPSILLDAFSLVHGNRGMLYDKPWHDYARVTKQFNAVMGEEILSPAEGIMFMLCVKMSRLAFGIEQGYPPELLQDHLTDLAGYADTLWGVLLNPEVEETEEEESEEEYDDDDY